MSRRSHLVGTIPAPGAREAMEMALDELGPTLDMLPDGETGERLDWVRQIIEGMRENPDVELAREGDWTDYDDSPQFRVKRGHKLRGDSIDLGYARFFRESYPVFQAVVAERGMPESRRKSRSGSSVSESQRAITLRGTPIRPSV